MWATSLGGPELTSITASTSSVHIWDGTADTSWYTGDEDSYEIYTLEELAGLAKLTRELPVNTFDGIAINLMSDIVLNDTTNWQSWEKTPPKNSWKCIGANSHPFTGGFNGNGHTISGLYMLSDGGALAIKFNEVGLFDTISGAVICDLRMENVLLSAWETEKRVFLRRNRKTAMLKMLRSRILSLAADRSQADL